MTSGHTDEAIFPFVTDRYKECGLHTVVALKESTGFVFNRIWAAIKRECLGVLAEGVSTPDVIDAICTITPRLQQVRGRLLTILKGRRCMGAKSGPAR